MYIQNIHTESDFHLMGVAVGPIEIRSKNNTEISLAVKVK